MRAMPELTSFLRRLAQESGLTHPRKALLRWPPDAHLLVAGLAALPVWVALAWLLGPALYRPASPGAWLAFMLLWPLVEELLFRGLLQGQLLRLSGGGERRGAVWPLSRANLLTTAAFVAVHLGTQPWLWALAVAAPSLVFGHLRERLGSVWPAVLLHGVYNAGFACAAWWAAGWSGYHPALP
jgi:membrane protease YdiL (CAAX protease family)